MNDILLLDKKNKNLRILFKEKQLSLSESNTPNDIFHNPAKLLENCGLNGILNNEPFKYIRTAGRVWEFYLLRFAENIGRNQYNKLIRPIPRQNQEPIKGCSRMKLGNPYNIWINNYQEIKNNKLVKTTKSFAQKLISRKCPIRQQKGGSDFIRKRRNAAKQFFKFLIGGKITKQLFRKLQNCEDFQEKLYFLIKKYPKNELFLASGLMTCLYGGKNVNWVNAKLAKILSKSLDENYNRKTNDIINKLFNILHSKSNRSDFKPPFKNIYDVKGGNRERVNINFRIQTWLKLMKDTLDASK